MELVCSGAYRPHELQKFAVISHCLVFCYFGRKACDFMKTRFGDFGCAGLAAARLGHCFLESFCSGRYRPRKLHKFALNSRCLVFCYFCRKRRDFQKTQFEATCLAAHQPTKHPVAQVPETTGAGQTLICLGRRRRALRAMIRGACFLRGL